MFGSLCAGAARLMRCVCVMKGSSSSRSQQICPGLSATDAAVLLPPELTPACRAEQQHCCSTDPTSHTQLCPLNTPQSNEHRVARGESPGAIAGGLARGQACRATGCAQLRSGTVPSTCSGMNQAGIGFDTLTSLLGILSFISNAFSLPNALPQPKCYHQPIWRYLE